MRVSSNKRLSVLVFGVWLGATVLMPSPAYAQTQGGSETPAPRKLIHRHKPQPTADDALRAAAEAFDKVGTHRSALTGEVIWDFPSNSCGPDGGVMKTKISQAMSIAFDNMSGNAMRRSLIRQRILSYTDSFPEVILSQMLHAMPTEVECRDLTAAFGHAPISCCFPSGVHEYLELDRTWVANPMTTPEEIAATILHEIAHNKGYQHADDPVQPFEYFFSVPVQIQNASRAQSGLPPLLTNADRSRDSLPFETTLAPVGWANGNAYQRSCPAREVAKGLRVRTGNVVDAIGLVCGPPNGAPTSRTSMAGGEGGRSRELACNDDEVLVGIRGRAASVNDRIAPICAAGSDVAAGSASGETRRQAGGTGGFPYQRVCPSSMAVRSIKGKAGTFVDRIEVRCQLLQRLETVSENVLERAGGTGGSVTLEKCAGRAALVGLTFHAGTRIDRLGGTCADITTTGTIEAVDTNADRFYQMPAHGGTGGQAGERRCAPGSALVGLQVRAATEIDAIGGLCAVASDWTTTSIPSPGITADGPRLSGGSGGMRKTLPCPRGAFLVGWRIGHATRVDSIQPVCRNFR